MFSVLSIIVLFQRWRGSLAELMAKADRTGHLRGVLDIPEDAPPSESAASEGNWGPEYYNTSAVRWPICIAIQSYRLLTLPDLPMKRQGLALPPQHANVRFFYPFKDVIT